MPIATAPPPPNPSTLPPPQTFDFVRPLHPILSRLLLPPTLSATSPQAPDTTASLSPKDVATAVSGVIAKIQRARTAVQELPGVEVEVEEQEVLIGELEAEVRRLAGVIEGVGRRAGEQDGKGTGKEGTSAETMVDG